MAPSLPLCTLKTAFQCSETNAAIPPAFYPGQDIPTVLTFHLGRHSTLAHSLNPSLTMSLIGSLHLAGGPPRIIICVSVSLAEGLELWARDAQQALASSPTHMVDPTICLPGGTYSLPLTVQVPSTPRLPPSFTVPGGSFAVTYDLEVTLSCDDPLRPGLRVNLAAASRPFEMMPETMPTRTPKYSSTTFRVKAESTILTTRMNKSTTRRPHSRWTVKPFLPTTAYSPTSRIPIRLVLTPPDDLEHAQEVLVRVALVRREHSSVGPNDLHDPSGQAGLVREIDIGSQVARFEIPIRQSLNIQTTLPIMIEASWSHGFSTMLNVGSPGVSQETIAVSSTFHLAITLAFLPSLPGGITLGKIVPAVLPPFGVWSEPQAGSTLDMPALKRHFPGSIRTLPLPLVIGSVSEPRSAMQTIRWSDWHLDNSSGEEVGTVISGETVSCEDGWIHAPPSYAEAVDDVPYVF